MTINKMNTTELLNEIKKIEDFVKPYIENSSHVSFHMHKINPTIFSEVVLKLELKKQRYEDTYSQFDYATYKSKNLSITLYVEN